MKGKNNESEVKEENRKSLPILTPGIGSRIERVSKMLGGNAAAGRAANKSDIQIGRYVREMSAPTVDVIVALSKAAGVSIEWLATGEGSSERHMVNEPSGTYTATKTPAEPSVALYARLVGPLHDLVDDENEREEVMVQTLKILGAAAQGDSKVLNRYSSQELRSAVSLALASKRLKEG